MKPAPAEPEIDELWDYNKLAESEVRFRELLAQTAESGDGERLAELLTQIARAEGLQEKYGEAGQTLDRALSLLPAQESRGRIRYLLERGRVLNSSAKPNESKPYFLEAWDLASRLEEDFYAVDAAHMLGIVETGDSQLEWGIRALELAQASDQERAGNWLGSLYNNIGWSFQDLGRYDEALKYFLSGLEWQRAHNRDREARIASWTVGRCLRSMGKTNEAFEIQLENLKALDEAGEPDGFVHEEVGECLLVLGKRSEAAPHFARAYELLGEDPQFQKGQPKRLQRLQDLSYSQ